MTHLIGQIPKRVKSDTFFKRIGYRINDFFRVEIEVVKATRAGGSTIQFVPTQSYVMMMPEL